MLTRLLRGFLPAMLVGLVGPQLAHADVYTWVDAAGAVNVSNLAPPDGVRVTSIIHASAPAVAAREAAARDAARQAEVQALEEHVRQLESDVQLASRQPPPQMEYRAMPAPPVVQYIVMPPAAQYTASPAPAVNGGCDSAWMDCGLWQFPGWYPTSVVLLRAQNFRNPHAFRSGHQITVQQPMHPPGVFRRG